MKVNVNFALLCFTVLFCVSVFSNSYLISIGCFVYQYLVLLSMVIAALRFPSLSSVCNRAMLNVAAGNPANRARLGT